MIKKANILFLLLSVGVGVIAQEKELNAYNRTINQNNNASAIAPGPVTPNINRKTNLKTYGQYLSFLGTNILPLEREARKNGFTATPEEISAQETAFKTLFPGMPVNQELLRTEVLARKYSQTLSPTTISDDNIQNAYKQMQLEYSNGNALSLTDLRPMLEMRALLENRSVQGKVEEINAFRQREQNQALLKSNEDWSQEEVRLKGPDDECIARHKDSASCLLTIKKFNDFIYYRRVPKLLRLDSARVWAVRDILRDFYIMNEARAKGFTESDSAREEKQEWMRDFIATLKFRKIGLEVRDRNSLWKTYSMFYDALFKTRYFPYFSILGSNDSLFIDSISRICKHPAKMDSNSRQKNSMLSNAVSAIPWSHSCVAFLPEDFSGAADSLPVNGVSDMIRTPYGFFLLRLDSVQVRYERTFKDAYNDLVILASKQKWLKMDSLLLEKARSIYASNKLLNRLPDTLLVTAFLSPEFARDSLKDGNTTAARGKRDAKADSMKAGVRISSARLPFDVRDSLQGRYEVVRDKKAMIGPIRSRFGVWNFKVLDKKGEGGVRPFSIVQKQLIDSLAARELECPLDISSESPDSAFVQTALAKSYELRFFGIMDDGNEDDPNSQEIRDQKRLARENEIKAWLLNITIRPIVFSHNLK